MHLEQKVRWSEEEITFLKFSYPNKEFTLDEIIKALPNRSKAAIQQKAHSLGLNLYNPPKPPDGFKKCTSCDTILPLDFFHNNKNNLDGNWGDCKFCVKKKADARKAVFDKEAVFDEKAETKICRCCFLEKPLTEFHRFKKSKDGRKNDCKICAAKKYRQWYIRGGY